jgi:hypothetical protein
MSKIAVNEITDEVGTGAPAFPNGMSVTGAALTDPEITGGIYLGGTGSANYLEDYEEGTWTPTFIAALLDYSDMTGLTVNNATYTKIGNVVRVQGEIVPIGTSGTKVQEARIEFGGLPFSSITTDDNFNVVGAAYGRNSLNNNRGWHGFMVLDSDSTIINITMNGQQPGGTDQNDEQINFFAVYTATS